MIVLELDLILSLIAYLSDKNVTSPGNHIPFNFSHLLGVAIHGSSRAHALTMPNAYPEIQGGGSLILAWQIRNKQVLVVGGGEVGVALQNCDDRQWWSN